MYNGIGGDKKMNMVEANSANYERLEKKYRKLNKRQEEFCLNILSGKTAKESYIFPLRYCRST